MEVLVFKTNIRSKKELPVLKRRIETEPSIFQWNMDLKDCDKILRVISSNIQPVMIESMMEELGYFCEELK